MPSILIRFATNKCVANLNLTKVFGGGFRAHHCGKRGFSMRRRFGCLFGSRRSYAILGNIDNSYLRDFDDGESHDIASNGPVIEMVTKKTMHLRRIWSRNFFLALLTTAVLDLHLG